MLSANQHLLLRVSCTLDTLQNTDIFTWVGDWDVLRDAIRVAATGQTTPFDVAQMGLSDGHHSN